MMDRLRGMSVFVKAADTGSFAAAGAALGMSSQMAGKHVAAIEARLGARLFNRTTRRQGLTEIGRLYYERCKAVLAEAEAAETIVQDLAATPRGRLRLTAPVTYGGYCLMPAVARYLASYPATEIDLTLTDRFVDLIDEGYDAAIRLGPLTDSTLIARALPPYRLLACASPAYLAQRGVPEAPGDLAGHDCLGYAYTARPPAREWIFEADGKRHVVALRSRFQVNNARAQLAAALAGTGIILGAEAMLAPEVAAGRLVRVLPGFEAPPRPVHLLFPPGRTPPPKLRCFIDLVVAVLSGSTEWETNA